ncbi:ABC transporter ATP-binding protein [Catellatospora methionotrophica]|uniref:ABC transporter ATP-binding protein n=2 Tax=Catellatospora methionotrophica TaxID=121620 RepID=A0A8J3L4J4_9ACTN|nr:oligopeptide/dipeptide ABC transporter ATP-binding protein [Catellatospora methionotrophica]GIG11992.1 ABC transporter ATP-binding protein [Catellatospora methionotrophica]
MASPSADTAHPTAAAVPVAGPLLEVRDLSMHFIKRAGLRAKIVSNVRAVEGVDLTIHEGETVGLVGETGCGKSTLGRCIVRAYEPTSGQIHYRRRDGQVIDAAKLRRSQLKPYQGEVRLVFQDPYSSLNPRMNLLQIISEPLLLHGMTDRVEREQRVADLLTRVGLRPEFMRRYPHAFSGGQRQRVSIARALALDPRLVIADEAVSALDVSVRAQILNLLEDLRAEAGLTYLMITHDLGVVDYLCQRVAVMYLGRIVEFGTTEEVYGNPRHPYTETLLAAIPKPDPRQRGQRTAVTARGELPDPGDAPPGCPFSSRCPYATDLCRNEMPPLRETSTGHLAACHRTDELSLRPA